MLTVSLNQSFNKANQFTKQGDIEKAINIYNIVLQKFPKNFKALKALKSI